MHETILMVVGNRVDVPSFSRDLQKKGYDVRMVTTGRAALNHLQQEPTDLVVVNAASLRTSGIRICNLVRNCSNGLPIVLISESETTTPKNINANVVLHLPFTIRKLVNRVVQLLPSEEGRILTAGPIRLNLELKYARVIGRRGKKLTPRVAQILQMLMTNPGKVIPRKDLFCEVWNTDYTGDMRTLDTHISWLRHAIEEDPRKPRFIKTVRGIGYQLLLDEPANQ